MITAASLNAQKSKELAQLAKENGVSGWHSMKKSDLIKALLKVARNGQRRSTAKKSVRATAVKTQAKTAKPRVAKALASESSIALKLRREREQQENLKNLALVSQTGNRAATAPSMDRLVVIVRDSFWLQGYWEITKASVNRARVAIGTQWHLAKPVLRVMKVVSDGNTNSVEQQLQEIEIHSGVSNWYFQNPAPGATLRLAIGYAVGEDTFHLIAKSNEVTPSKNAKHQRDENWTDITNDVERYFAMSGGLEETVTAELQHVMEEKSQQSVYTPAFERLGTALNIGDEQFEFQVDAHLVVHGSAAAGASVSVAGQPVKLKSDGTFAVRMKMNERRQVLPVVAANRNGTQQRTTVLAIERNTKVMDPIAVDPS
ncbi:DUF4912 domain-containing protein [Mariniblastus sp.]|nr:DUF4912 domain-containing protein [Mariniblastus sp.]